MFDETYVNWSQSQQPTEGQLPSDLAFPYISALSHPATKIRDEVDTTTAQQSHIVEDVYEKLYEEVHQAYVFARLAFHGIEEQQLERAFAEAKILAASRLFGAELVPNVSVDPYGEFTFSHRSAAGYVDIGVRGEGELSYHVRNDADPTETRFEDYDWSELSIPWQLFNALRQLRQHL